MLPLSSRSCFLFKFWGHIESGREITTCHSAIPARPLPSHIDRPHRPHLYVQWSHSAVNLKQAHHWLTQYKASYVVLNQITSYYFTCISGSGSRILPEKPLINSVHNAPPDIIDPQHRLSQPSSCSHYIHLKSHHPTGISWGKLPMGHAPSQRCRIPGVVR